MFDPARPRPAIIPGVILAALLVGMLLPAPCQAAALQVKKGDPLWEVAETYKASLLTVQKINRLQGFLLIPGQLLFVSEPKPGTPSRKEQAVDSSRGAVNDLIASARRFLGRPYCYGGNGPSSFDCSGFVQYVYSCYGIGLPRIASDQAGSGTKVTTLARGDLVFFSDRMNGYITHVGIYTGNNSFIHASNSLGVTITSLEEPWYKQRFVSACRILQ